MNLYKNGLKRILDVLLSGIALIILTPIFIIICVLILKDDFGPIFFKQKRVGKDEKIFEVFKFRTMYINAEKYQKLGVEVTGEDPRITKLGYFLRRFKLDELPQLYNILKGDMSIIGPRPSLPDYLKIYKDWERERFRVKPGLSGLAQVNGNIYLSRIKRSRLDVKYVRELSFSLDLKIVLKTILVIIFGEKRFKK